MSIDQKKATKFIFLNSNFSENDAGTSVDTFFFKKKGEKFAFSKIWCGKSVDQLFFLVWPSHTSHAYSLQKNNKK